MNLHALRIFHKTAQLGSVTRAAEQLRMSQPAVTAQIRNLERDLDLVLLIPQGRGIALTEIGQSLADHANRLFAYEYEIERQMDDFRQGRQGKLRIAATYLPANFLLPQLIVKFKQMYSQVEIHLMTLNNSNALDKLKNFEADIAIIGGEVEENPELSRQNWIEDECWFIAPSDHPYAGQEVSFRTLMAEPFIMREEGIYMRKKLLALCQLHSVASPRTAIQWTGSQETIRSVMAGYGITFVSSLEVREEIRRGKIARVLVPDIQASNPISIYFRREGSLSLPASNLNIFLNEENVLAKF